MPPPAAALPPPSPFGPPTILTPPAEPPSTHPPAPFVPPAASTPAPVPAPAWTPGLPSPTPAPEPTSSAPAPGPGLITTWTGFVQGPLDHLLWQVDAVTDRLVAVSSLDIPDYFDPPTCQVSASGGRALLPLRLLDRLASVSLVGAGGEALGVQDAAVVPGGEIGDISMIPHGSTLAATGPSQVSFWDTSTSPPLSLGVIPLPFTPSTLQSCSESVLLVADYTGGQVALLTRNDARLGELAWTLSGTKAVDLPWALACTDTLGIALLDGAAQRAASFLLSDFYQVGGSPDLAITSLGAGVVSLSVAIDEVRRNVLIRTLDGIGFFPFSADGILGRQTLLPLPCNADAVECTYSKFGMQKIAVLSELGKAYLISDTIAGSNTTLQVLDLTDQSTGPATVQTTIDLQSSSPAFSLCFACEPSMRG
eukprot:SM000177S03187  [mRNA]  locus=s177:157063:158750:- [translate_table: standard]